MTLCLEVEKFVCALTKSIVVNDKLSYLSRAFWDIISLEFASLWDVIFQEGFGRQFNLLYLHLR